MTLRLPLMALLLVGAGAGVPHLLPRAELPGRAAGHYAQQALDTASSAVSGPLERLAVRRLEVLRVVRPGGACPYRADVLARSWFGEPYANVTVDCSGATVSRD